MGSEDRRLYHLQNLRKGHIGFTTAKTASSNIIHPSTDTPSTSESGTE